MQLFTYIRSIPSALASIFHHTAPAHNNDQLHSVICESEMSDSESIKRQEAVFNQISSEFKREKLQSSMKGKSIETNQIVDEKTKKEVSGFTVTAIAGNGDSPRKAQFEFKDYPDIPSIITSIRTAFGVSDDQDTALYANGKRTSFNVVDSPKKLHAIAQEGNCFTLEIRERENMPEEFFSMIPPTHGYHKAEFCLSEFKYVDNIVATIKDRYRLGVSDEIFLVARGERIDFNQIDSLQAFWEKIKYGEINRGPRLFVQERVNIDSKLAAASLNQSSYVTNFSAKTDDLRATHCIEFLIRDLKEFHKVTTITQDDILKAIKGAQSRQMNHVDDNNQQFVRAGVERRLSLKDEAPRNYLYRLIEVPESKRGQQTLPQEMHIALNYDINRSVIAIIPGLTFNMLTEAYSQSSSEKPLDQLI